MRLLILGGIAFLGRALVDVALAHEHSVTLFNRGQTHPGLYPEVEHLRGPGLIFGPHDPTDRFTYWPHRVAHGGRVLAPGHPARPIVHRRPRSRSMVSGNGSRPVW